MQEGRGCTPFSSILREVIAGRLLPLTAHLVCQKIQEKLSSSVPQALQSQPHWRKPVAKAWLDVLIDQLWLPEEMGESP